MCVANKLKASRTLHQKCHQLFWKYILLLINCHSATKMPLENAPFSCFAGLVQRLDNVLLGGFSTEVLNTALVAKG
jgi:hypothetical protein